jgi:hypothetical protein
MVRYVDEVGELLTDVCEQIEFVQSQRSPGSKSFDQERARKNDEGMRQLKADIVKAANRFAARHDK